MDKKTAIKIVKKYSNTVRKHFQVEAVILFGSYSKNKQREESDIDVAVIVKKLDKDYLTSSALLFKLTRDIDLSIEPILFLKGRPDPSGFLDELLKTGIIIYKANS
jgi:predicted nucleotidyltransferase